MNYKEIGINHLGHASVQLKFGALVIYIDPFKLSSGLEKADIILITHSHYDHCFFEDINKIVKNGTRILMSNSCQSKIMKVNSKIEMKILEPGSEVEVNGVKIKAVPAYNMSKHFHSKEEDWNGYILEIGGNRVYHAGDTDLIPEMAGLGKINVAFLPVGGNFTMNAEEAAKAASIIKPEIAVPIHYGEIVGTKEDALRFNDICEREGIRAEIL